MFANRGDHFGRFRSMRGGVYTLEGGIGAGKTTLGRSAEKFLNRNGLQAKFYPEYVNKPLLNQYLGDMAKYAYTFQLFMLSKRIEIYRDAERFAATGGIALIDRSIIGDMTFARMLVDDGKITAGEFAIYQNLMKEEIQLVPQASVYLYCTAQTLLLRVHKRGIKSEIAGYTPEYMNKLHAAYMTSMKACTNVPHILLDWNAPALLETGLVADSMVVQILDRMRKPTKHQMVRGGIVAGTCNIAHGYDDPPCNKCDHKPKTKEVISSRNLPQVVTVIKADYDIMCQVYN